MTNSDSVLSANERVIVAIIAVIIHIFLAIFFFLNPVWERPIPAPEPAGITMVSFGNVITPTETPAPSQSERLQNCALLQPRLTYGSQDPAQADRGPRPFHFAFDFPQLLMHWSQLMTQ